MAKRTTPIPVAPLYRILRKAGASRVGQDAKLAMVEAVLQVAEAISSRAVELAKHAGRKTVHEDDIRLAIRELRGL
ncbi:MAG: NFYB/HAP3 family transcription factor subunit [Candidatus Nanopusillus acidilobi]|jgi:histone H3/H4|nr:NFYB/HAP3 family transcription factor subunit [Candidatus Nanopusillus sp.]MCG2869079.1 NFYB/HAP3 family transcription factor subunit [Candidatus Nanopusillus sp.]MCG2883251.1 NFYB/HAP3 family transcription factor subunit [Candidatus Nanopusillus sp.]